MWSSSTWAAPAAIQQLTEVNADILAGKRLGEVEEIWYESTGGTQVQGWIVKPPDFDPGQRYPLILHIHGGPHGMYNVGFSYPYQNFAANGYVTLYTNPRGSTGYGTDFGNAIDNGYPSVDYDDLMAGVDALLEQGYVNEDQMYVTGCSGGGVLSSWVIGHTTPLRRCGSALPGRQLDELCRHGRHHGLGLLPLPRLPLGQSGQIPRTLAPDVRRERDYADPSDDRRA